MTDIQLQLPSPILSLNPSFPEFGEVAVWMKREELIHPEVTANKWRKLKYNLQAAREQGFSKLLTFGGAYSNHIAATAAAGKYFQFETIGIIRGEHIEPLNPTLQKAEADGMQLVFISRGLYRQKKEPTQLAQWQADYGPAYIIPEGGTNQLALKGCREIVEEMHQQCASSPTHICVPCGTGGTAAGLLQGKRDEQKLEVFSSLKGNFLQKEIQQLLDPLQVPNWQVHTNYHFGGYAKTKPALLDFIRYFESKSGILIEQVYTGKMLYGVFELIKKGYFQAGDQVVVIHTGGLQGKLRKVKV